MSQSKKKTDVSYMERTNRNHFFIGKEEGQRQLRKLKIGIAGLGGMGSNIAEQFARLGVGELSLAEQDVIDISNINRQVIANFNTVGKYKIDASCEELYSIAPDLKLNVFKKGITKENVFEFIDGCQFIVDEIDVFPLEAHKILHDACRSKNIPVYSAYVIGLGIHFYKFSGNEFTFDDFIEIKNDDTNQERFKKIISSFIPNPPSYMSDDNLIEFSKVANDEGVPIFGSSCLVGHSIVVTRVLCDFLNNKILGVDVPKTPIMPEYLKIDLCTMEIERKKFKTE